MTREEWNELFSHPDVGEVRSWVLSTAAARDDLTELAFMVKVIKTGMTRLKALSKDNERNKLAAKGEQIVKRAYAPKFASDKARVETKRRAMAEGIGRSAEVRGSVCGHENIRGERCILSPHSEGVPHRF